MHDDTPTTGSPPPSRALVLSGTLSPVPVHPAPRPLATFVTQLFACETRLEPFRRNRRAGPDRGVASYEASEHAETALPRFERVL
jgi:hypothetical protein